MSVQIFTNYYPIHEGLYREMLELTKPLRVYYPNFEEWYKQTFMDGLKHGNRRYVVAGVHGKVTGCCLLKDTQDEKKICTFYIAPQFRHRGIGTLMMMAALQEFLTPPIITFPEEKKQSFSPFLRRFGFRELKQCLGLYRPQKIEYVYTIPAKTNTCRQVVEKRLVAQKGRV